MQSASVLSWSLTQLWNQPVLNPTGGQRETCTRQSGNESHKGKSQKATAEQNVELSSAHLCIWVYMLQSFAQHLLCVPLRPLAAIAY